MTPDDPTIAREEALTRRVLLSRGALIVGSAGLVPMLVGCGSGKGGGSDKRIAFAQPDTSSAVYPLLLAGAKKEASSRGYTLLQSSANSKLDAQLSELNTWIGQKIGGIIVLPLDNDAMAPVIKRANRNGVKILDYSDKALPNTDGWVIFDNLQGARLVGEHAGKWVNDKLQGKAKVALLTHEVQQTGRERIGGAVKALQSVAPGAEVVARQEGVLAADTLTVFRSMLQAHPDINVVFCIADDGCLGTERAFMQTNPSQARQDRMYMAGWDGSLPVFRKIVEGGVIRSTGALDLIGIGSAAIRATANAVEGKRPTEINYPYVLVSQDDPAKARQFIKRYTAAGG